MFLLRCFVDSDAILLNLNRIFKEMKKDYALDDVSCCVCFVCYFLGKVLNSFLLEQGKDSRRRQDWHKNLDNPVMDIPGIRSGVDEVSTF